MNTFSEAKVIELYKDKEFRHLATSAAYELSEGIFIFGSAFVYPDKQNRTSLYYDTPEVFVLISKHKHFNITDLEDISISQNNIKVNLQSGNLNHEFWVHNRFNHITKCILDKKQIPIIPKELFDNLDYFFFKNICIETNTFNNGILGLFDSIRIKCNIKNGLLRECSEIVTHIEDVFSRIVCDWEECISKEMFPDETHISLSPKGYIMPQNLSNDAKIFLDALRFTDKGHYGVVKISNCISVDIQKNLEQGGELQIIKNYTSHYIKHFNTNELLAKALFVGKDVQFEIDINAPHKGLYSYINSITGVDEILCLYYETEELFEVGGWYRKSIQCEITTDIYTNQLSLVWNSWHNTKDLVKYQLVSLSFNIENGIPVLELYSEKPFIKKGDKITFLFGKQVKIGNICREEYNYSAEEFFTLSYFVKDKPTSCGTIIAHGRYKITLYLQNGDLSYFVNYGFISARIVHSRGDVSEVFNMYISEVEESIYLLKQRASLFAHILEKNNIPFSNNLSTGIKDNECEQEIQPNNESCYVYLMVDSINGYHKIGISNKPEYRERTLQSEKPTIELLCAKQYPTRMLAEAIESALHKVYAEKRIRGEWFVLNNQDIEHLKTMLNN